jgi:hypothetical protein
MGAHSDGRRTVVSFIGLTLGIVVLFGLVALVALQPRDGLTWVEIPNLAADLHLDATVQIAPLNNAAIPDAVRDQALTAGSSETLLIPAGLVAAGPFIATLIPAGRPTLSAASVQPLPLLPRPRPRPTPTPTPRPHHEHDHGGD